ncbi:MAG: small ribosomal subunit Rsm22 family protein [Treponemataceae bacterium]
MKKTEQNKPFYSAFVREKKQIMPHEKISSTQADFETYKKVEKNSFAKCPESSVKVKKIKSLFSLNKQKTQKEADILENFDKIIQDLYPLSAKQLKILPYNVKKLSHLLTDERNDRLITYMNDKSHLSAYMHYFMWWNLIRLSAVFTALPENAFSFLQDDSCVLDMGSGTLTLPIALWLSRPELRKKKLTIYCMDISATSLATGKEIFTSIVAKTQDTENKNQIEEWKIVAIKGTFGAEIRKKIDFVTCANMFNEMLWNCQNQVENFVATYFKKITAYTNEKVAFFIAEPGIPLGGRFISHFRNILLKNQFKIKSPCPHEKNCCMTGEKGDKWCHFVLHSENNFPKKLENFSKKCALPKDRASISFIFADNFSNPILPSKNLSVRITSDIIQLPPHKTGRYACSHLGLLLIVGNVQKYIFGSHLEIELPSNFDTKKLSIDKKSGAKIIFVGS